jgi:hypothetical protein
MHKDVRQAEPGKCLTCGMALVQEGTRFAMLQHIMSNPLHLLVMGAIMVVLMIAAIMKR